MKFDPNPPYTVLGTPQLPFNSLERLRTVSRILDLTFNSGRFSGFLKELANVEGGFAGALERLALFFQRHDLLRHPLSQRGIFEAVGRFIDARECSAPNALLRERLARDYARSERVSPHNPPLFFDITLTAEEVRAVRDEVRRTTDRLKGHNTKVQHFAAAFSSLPEYPGRRILLFLYLTRTGEGMSVEERVLPA